MAQGQSEAVVLTGFALRPPLPRAYVTNLCGCLFEPFITKSTLAQGKKHKRGQERKSGGAVNGMCR